MAGNLTEYVVCPYAALTKGEKCRAYAAWSELTKSNEVAVIRSDVPEGGFYCRALSHLLLSSNDGGFSDEELGNVDFDRLDWSFDGEPTPCFPVRALNFLLDTQRGLAARTGCCGNGRK